MAASPDMAAVPDDTPDLRAADQQEIFFLNFLRCFNCRAGSCSKHGAAAGTASAPSSITDADAEKTREAMTLTTHLPPELQLEIANNFDVCTFFSMVHAPQFQPLRVTHETAFFRRLQHRFKRESEVFGSDFLESHFRNGNGKPNTQMYYLFLEIIQKSTDAVVAHLTTELALPPDFARSLRHNVLRLWRVFGTTGSAHDDRTVLKQEAFDYLHALGARECKVMMKCLRELGVQYEGVYPLPQIKYETGPDAKLFAEFQETGRFKFVLHYFIMEYVRMGMTKVFAQVSQGEALDTDDAFGRSGIAPWTARTDQPASKDPISGFLVFDAWTYWVSFDDYCVRLELPEHHKHDLYMGLIFDACIEDLPCQCGECDNNDDEPVTWNEETPAGLDMIRRGLDWPRDPDDDPDDDLDDDTDERVAWLWD